MTLHSIVPRNGVQSPQTLFPRAGDVIHQVLWNRGLAYETTLIQTCLLLLVTVVNAFLLCLGSGFVLISVVSHDDLNLIPYPL